MPFLPKSKLWRAIIVLGGFVLLVVIFYAEEDLRGWLAWTNYKHEWEAKGEHFDFASFVPPPVSDDRNFALTPIVATSYEWILDRNGHEIKPHRTNIVERLYMKILGDWYPDERFVHYPTNHGGWEMGQMTDLKGFQLYYRALAAKTNEFPVSAQPQSPAADVLLALSKVDSDIEELRNASRLPDSRFPLNYDAKLPFAVYLMHLYPLRTCCQVLQLRAVAELQNSQSNKALADVKLSLRLIDSIRNEPNLSSHRNRIEMLNMTIQPVWEALVEYKWSETQLVELDQKLAELDFLADIEFSTRGERATSLETIDYLRRTRDFDAVTPLVRLSNVPTPREEVLKEKAKSVFSHLVPDSVFYRNKLNYARIYQQSFLPIVNVERRTVSPDMAAKFFAAVGKLNEHWSPNKWPDHLLFPASIYMLKRFAYAQSSVDMARVACALERYRLAHGEYPETLDALAPQFMEKIPHDIIGGQPLHYRRAGEGRFILYSVGWNEADDGGVVSLRRPGSVELEKGDWVWQYPSSR